MRYLLIELWLWLLLSFVLGALCGWQLKAWRAQRLRLALADAGARRAALESELGRARVELADVRERFRKLEAEQQAGKAALEARIAALDARAAELAELAVLGAEPVADGAVAAAAAREQALAERIAELEAGQATSAATLAAAQARAAALATEVEQGRVRLLQQQRDSAFHAEELGQVREVARILEQQKAELARALAIASGRAQPPPAEQSSAEADAQLALRAELEAGQARLYELTRERTDLLASMHQHQDAIEDLRTQLAAARDAEAAQAGRVENLQARIAQLQVELQDAIERAATPPSAPRLDLPDDLQAIIGIGPKLAALLHGLGIRQFRQIALWSDADQERIARELPAFARRIRRDDWRGQSRTLHRLKYGTDPA